MMLSRSSLCILFGGASLLLADVQYEQTGRVTGGSLANIPVLGSKLKEPQTTTHLIKGSRMALIAKDSVTIYDLDRETVTDINNAKREYSVMTFAEMREAMDKAMQKMQQSTQKQGAEMTWAVKVDDTGESRNINGFAAKKFAVTLDGVTKDPKSGKTFGTRMAMDCWVTQDAPGAAEMNAFSKKMAEKLGAGRASGMAPMVQAQLGKGWYEAAKEFQKMDGFQVMTVVRTSTVVDGQVLMVPESQQNSGQQVDIGEAAKGAAAGAAVGSALGRLGRAGAIGGALGGLGRRNKKSTEEPAKQPEAKAGEKMVPATMMEMTMEVTSMSRNAVDAARFDVPAGYKQVEAELKKLAK